MLFYKKISSQICTSLLLLKVVNQKNFDVYPIQDLPNSATIYKFILQK